MENSENRDPFGKVTNKVVTGRKTSFELVVVDRIVDSSPAPAQFGASYMTMDSVEGLDEPDIPLETVTTVWYRCRSCRCCFHALPILAEHAREVHSVEALKLPRDLPEFALKGQMHFTYELFTVPPPFPSNFVETQQTSGKPMSNYSMRSRRRSQVSNDSSKTAVTPVVPLPSLDASSEQCNMIRIRDIRELKESSCSESEVEKDSVMQSRQEGESCPMDGFAKDQAVHDIEMSPVTSPHDSGIQNDTASDVVEEESVPKSAHCDSSLSTKQGFFKEVSATSTKSVVDSSMPKVDSIFPCKLCKQRFKAKGALNFHLKKIHKTDSATHDKLPLKEVENLSAKPGTSRQKIKESIQRECHSNVKPSTSKSHATSGSNNNSSRVTGKAHQSDSSDEEIFPKKTSKRARRLSSDSEETKRQTPKKRRSARIQKASASESEDTDTDSSYSPGKSRGAMKNTRRGRPRKAMTKKFIVSSSESKDSSDDGLEREVQELRNRNELVEPSESELSDKTTTDSDAESSDKNSESGKKSKGDKTDDHTSGSNGSATDSSDEDLFIPVVKPVKKALAKSKK